MDIKFKKIASMLDSKLGIKKREQLLNGYNELNNDSPADFAKWVQELVEKLDDEPKINLTELFAKSCPCQIETEKVMLAKKIFSSSRDINHFISEMNKQAVIGKDLRFNDQNNMIYITKLKACDCGGGYLKGDSIIAKACHCDYVNASTKYLPISYCYCAAEFFRPLFEPLFGEGVIIEPIQTVLDGANECIFAVKLQK